MAKTIGKHNGAASSARRPAGATDAPVSDENREDRVDAETETDLESDSSDVEHAAGDDLALPESRALQRRASSEVAMPQRASRVRQAMSRTALTRYLYESVEELKKVTYPTRPEAWNMTLMVIFLSAFVAAILGLADVALIRALSWIVGIGAH